jgi:imidazolonepropionase-like amidohydrolase
MLGVQASSLRGIETLLAEAMESAGGGLAVHVDLALDLTPAERWTNAAALPATVLPALWAHAECAPRGLLGAVRERGDSLCATGVGAASALVRESEVAWGSDDGVNAPPLPEGVIRNGAAEAHYRRLFTAGARWASEHFGEQLGQVRPGAPADVILLDYRPATELSTRTLDAHLWSGLLRAPVAGVMVAGTVIVDNGVVVSVDEGQVAARARECATRVWSRLG